MKLNTSIRFLTAAAALSALLAVPLTAGARDLSSNTPGQAQATSAATLNPAYVPAVTTVDKPVEGVASAVPEPGSWALLAGGLLVLGGMQSLRRRHRA